MPSQTEQTARIIVIMGVSGCGKSSVGAGLAEREGVPFLDADDFHPVENVEKMRSGTPLNDADRWPWLDTFGKALRDSAAIEGKVFGACSALKRSYRDALAKSADEPVLFLHLDGPKELIAERMAARKDHYMPTGLLDSQIATLEPLNDHEYAAKIDLSQSLEAIFEECSQIIASRTL